VVDSQGEFRPFAATITDLEVKHIKTNDTATPQYKSADTLNESYITTLVPNSTTAGPLYCTIPLPSPTATIQEAVSSLPLSHTMHRPSFRSLGALAKLKTSFLNVSIWSALLSFGLSCKRFYITHFSFNPNEPNRVRVSLCAQAASQALENQSHLLWLKSLK
jgi:hypothetical protein